MNHSLSPKSMRVAVAAAAALCPPTDEYPETPQDVGFAPRLDGYLALLPRTQRLAVQLYFWALNWVPLLLLFSWRTFLGLSAARRE